MNDVGVNTWPKRRRKMADAQLLVRLLFIGHTLLELVLGAIKLRGTYSGVEIPDGANKFVRHHGVALLSLALLGGLIVWRRLEFSEAGTVASLVLTSFHTGCVAVMSHAADPKVLLVHLPFAAGFAIHAALGAPPKKRHP